MNQEEELKTAKGLLNRLLEIENGDGIFDRYADSDTYQSQKLSDLINDIETFLKNAE